ncbi:MAG: YggT family protein [Christensenellales bacterium]|jgi:uncharacterized protein YggT (Ycf19 family)
MINTVIGNILYGILIFLGIVSRVVFVYCILTWLYMPLNRLIDHGIMSGYRVNGAAQRKAKVLRFLKTALEKVFSFLSRLVDPLTAPFRRICDIMFGRRLFIDFSVLLLFFALHILQNIVAGLYTMVMYHGI